MTDRLGEFPLSSLRINGYLYELSGVHREAARREAENIKHSLRENEAKVWDCGLKQRLDAPRRIIENHDGLSDKRTLPDPDAPPPPAPLPPPVEVIVKDMATGSWKHYGQYGGTGKETSPAYGLDKPLENAPPPRRDAEGQKVCRYGNDCPDAGGPCPACDGTGAQDDGDPEIGQRLTDCDRCKGTGKTDAPPPPARTTEEPMTKASEVTINDATLDLIEAEFAKLGYLLSRQQLKDTAAVFAVVLAARVPDAMVFEFDPERYQDDDRREGQVDAHNVLRDAVLRGPG